MFGLEGQKNGKKPALFQFDLEKELENSRSRKEIKTKIEGRLQQIKEDLRSGEQKENYDQLGTLLQGYNALMKVIERVPSGK